MIRLVTHATRNYLPRMRPYLASLQANCPWPVTLLTVDCDAPAEFMEQFPKVTAVRVPKVAGSPENTDSLQHGAFIDYVPGNDTDVLIYTDGDIIMQRMPTQGEWIFFDQLWPGTVTCGWNSGPDETLAVEAARLFPKQDVAAVFGEMVNHAPCFNIGVIAARRYDWRQIHTAYMGEWDTALSTFGAQQRQQWLVCWALAALSLDVQVMPYSTHMHGCYPIPAGASLNGQAKYNGEPVLFRHHL